MKKRLHKSNNSMISGVCGGIAEYFSIDPTIVRLITVVIALCSTGIPIILIYFILAMIMPD